MTFLSLICSILLLSSQSRAAFNPNATNNLAIYWGQNSIGALAPDAKAQTKLSNYCQDPNVDIILLAFIEALNDAEGNMRINFANQLVPAGCNIDEHPYICPAIGEDIAKCQKNHNKTVLLSLGGASTPHKKGFSLEKAAKEGAVKIWQMFGPKQTGTQGVQRPFGDFVVDSVEFDFEQSVPNL